eukprot:jgi/Mesen1/4142/ME000218S03252
MSRNRVSDLFPEEEGDADLSLAPVEYDSDDEYDVGVEIELRPKKKLSNADVFEAARAGDVDRVSLLLSEGVDVNKRDAWDSVPLYYACLSGHRDVARVLLEAGAICAEHTFDGDRCHYASLNLRMRKLLKKYEARPPPLAPLATSLRGCFDSADWWPDIVLHLHGCQLRAHKAVLSARSRYFREAFRARWRDRAEIWLGSPRLSFPAMHALVLFFYTDRLELDADELEPLIRICRVCECGAGGLLQQLERERLMQKYRDHKAPQRALDGGDHHVGQKRYVLQGSSLPPEDRLPHALGRLLLDCDGGDGGDGGDGNGDGGSLSAAPSSSSSSGGVAAEGPGRRGADGSDGSVDGAVDGSDTYVDGADRTADGTDGRPAGGGGDRAGGDRAEGKAGDREGGRDRGEGREGPAESSGREGREEAAAAAAAAAAAGATVAPPTLSSTSPLTSPPTSSRPTSTPVTPVTSSAATSSSTPLMSLATHADLVVAVEGRRFECHRMILAARSEYFKALLARTRAFEEGGWAGGATSCRPVAVRDISAGTFGKLLEFIYTDSVSSVELEQAEEVFEAASRYLVFSLKRAAADALLPQLEAATPSDICYWLLLAEKYEVWKLREHCLDAIALNFETFAASPDFWRLLQALPGASGDDSARTSAPRAPGGESTAAGASANVIDDLREKWLEIDGAELEARDASAALFDARLRHLAALGAQEDLLT